MTFLFISCRVSHTLSWSKKENYIVNRDAPSARSKCCCRITITSIHHDLLITSWYRSGQNSNSLCKSFCIIPFGIFLYFICKSNIIMALLFLKLFVCFPYHSEVIERIERKLRTHKTEFESMPGSWCMYISCLTVLTRLALHSFWLPMSWICGKSHGKYYNPSNTSYFVPGWGLIVLTSSHVYQIRW